MNTATLTRCERGIGCQMDAACPRRFECASQVLAEEALQRARQAAQQASDQAADEAADEPLWTPDSAQKMCVIALCAAAFGFAVLVTSIALGVFDAPLTAAAAKVWAFVHALGRAAMNLYF